MAPLLLQSDSSLQRRQCLPKSITNTSEFAQIAEASFVGLESCCPSSDLESCGSFDYPNGLLPGEYASVGVFATPINIWVRIRER